MVLRDASASKNMLFHNFQSINMSERVYLEVHVHDASIESSLSVKGNLGVDFRCILVCTHIGWQRQCILSG